MAIRFVVPIALREVMEELLPQFQQMSGCSVDVQHMLNPEVPAYATSGNGWDIAITNPIHVQEMMAAQTARCDVHLPFGRSPLAFGKLGSSPVAPARDPERTAEILTSVESIAITDVGTSGDQFRNLAGQLEIWELIESRVVGLEGGGPMRALLAGEVELAGLPLTNIAPVPGVQCVASCPEGWNVHIDLSIALNDSADAATRRLADWLMQPALDERLAQLGANRFRLPALQETL
ncbi:MAG: substrate-binding domain-containing protein [Pseudomonadota bacterium]